MLNSEDVHKQCVALSYVTHVAGFDLIGVVQGAWGPLLSYLCTPDNTA